jgi:hypothetical protein
MSTRIKCEATIDLNGCFPWKVLIIYDYSPAERSSREHPGVPVDISIHEILRNGKDILDLFEPEFIKALEQDLGDGAEYRPARRAA